MFEFCRVSIRRRWSPCLAFAFAAFILAFPVLAISAQAVVKDAAETTRASSHVSQAADLIRAATTRGKRVRAAITLSAWVRKNPAEVGDAEMQILAGLLAEEDDIVRREAAAALGFLGPRAKPFIPQLLSALQERPCADQPAMSADAIHVVPERIGYGPMGFPCTDPARSPATTSQIGSLREGRDERALKVTV